MNKKIVVMGTIILIILSIFATFFYYKNVARESCGTPISINNITILYGGEPIEGQFYLFNTIDNWLSIEKIENSKFDDIYIFGDQIDEGVDTTLRIIKLDRNNDLNHNQIYDINYVINNDPNYERGKSEITKERILQDVRSYSIKEPEYFEIKDVFQTEVYNHHNIIVDLKTREIIKHTKTPDEELWNYCDM